MLQVSLNAPALRFLERSEGVGPQELFQGAMLLVAAVHKASLSLGLVGLRDCGR